MFNSISLEELGIDAEEVMAALPLKAETFTIFLSGSVLEGYGNTESDLDVFIIYSDQVPSQGVTYTRESYDISFEYISNWRLDVESWAKEQVFSVAQRLDRCSSEDRNACINVAFSDIQMAHRVCVGVPIRHPECFERLREAFDFEHLSHIIMTRCLVFCDGTTEDAAGAIDSEQHGAALLTSRQSVQLAIDALLAAHGETNPKDKWRFFKLEKLGDPTLLERYWALETSNISHQDDVLEYAKECLTFANQIVLRAQKTKRS
jgi:hypothetical protein